MKYGTKDIDWAELGAMLAHTDDNAQSAFLASFCKELRLACGTHYNTELQMVYIQKKLSDEDQELLEVLSDKEVN
jgi:hypothetical protein